MSDCSALKRFAMFVISRASLPSTGTGKKNSIFVAAAAGSASSARARAVAIIAIIRVMVFPSSAFDPGKHEAVDELPLEREERRQERQRDEQGAGGEQSPFLAALGARGEARETDRQRAFLRRIDDHQPPQELVPIRPHPNHRQR